MFFQVVVIVKQFLFLPLEAMKVLQINTMGKREATPKVTFPWWEQRQAMEIFRKKEIQWFTFFCLVWTCNYLKAKWKPEFSIPDLKAISKSFYNRPDCGSTVIYLTLVFCFLSTIDYKKLELNGFPENRRIQSIMTFFVSF